MAWVGTLATILIGRISNTALHIQTKQQEIGFTKGFIAYQRYWDEVASGNHLPPGMTAEEYTKYLGGLGKVGDAIALNRVDYDEIIKLRKGNEGASRAKNFDIDVAQQKLNNIRGQMPNQNLKTRGNMAIADVNVEGLPYEFVAHSKIHNSTSKGADMNNFSFTPEKKFFETYVEDGFPRYKDTEAKILEDIASKIKDPNMSGTINLFTELPACQSCTNIIFEFRRKFPNIELNVFTK